MLELLSIAVTANMYSILGNSDQDNLISAGKND